MKWIGYIWSFPYGLLGLLAAGLFYVLGWVKACIPDQEAIVLVCRGPLARFMSKRGWGAYTLGWTVLCWETPSAELLDHEILGHVHQALRWGIFMPIAYGICLLIFGYYNNPFERQAREVAARMVEQRKLQSISLG